MIYGKYLIYLSKSSVKEYGKAKRVSDIADGLDCGSDTMLCQSADQFAKKQIELYPNATEFHNSS